MSEARDAIDVGLGLHAQCDDLIAANVNRAEKAEALLDEALELMAGGLRWQMAAFLDRPEVKARLAAQEGGTR